MDEEKRQNRREVLKHVRPAKQALQLTFFEEQKNPVIEELLGVNVNSLTPLEALNLVSQLQAKAKAVRG